MAGSYREIDYRIRPGKHAERLMMVEAFRRLRFGSIESYQYVGLGSVYFTDFKLIHRALGITKMVSIEMAQHDKARFEANIPYGCVEMQWGETTTELPKIDLSLRSIVWLDYDGRLSKSVLADIREVSGRAVSGTVLAVTLQSRFDRSQDDTGEDTTVADLIEALGPERIPLDTDVTMLRGDGTSKLFRNIIYAEVSDTLSAKNVARPHAQHINFKQVMNFRYEDGVLMMTVAFVFYDAGQEVFFNLSGFDTLDFYRSGEDPFKISIPKLTPKEIVYLEGQMPKLFEDLQLAAIPPKDAKQFTSIYRYFPNINFVD